LIDQMSVCNEETPGVVDVRAGNRCGSVVRGLGEVAE
jgi:hypothetical protein